METQFEMYAARRDTHPMFRHIYPTAMQTEMCISKGNAVPVTVRICSPIHQTPDYWGWLDLEDENDRSVDMIFPSRMQLAMCFLGEQPLKEAVSAGRGVPVGLEIFDGHNLELSEPVARFDDVVALAKELHKHQKDLVGKPYTGHLEAVHDNLGPEATETERMAAWLHDTIEDCSIDDGAKGKRPLVREDLRALGVPRDVVEIVELLTRKSSWVAPSWFSAEAIRTHREKMYLEKIQGIIDSGNISAMKVKLADNRHNSCAERNSQLTKPSDIRRIERLQQRYHKSIDMLTSAISTLEAGKNPSL
ncbi:hypothetical protein [Thalassospira xiamenensis]|uniref:HD domain-containing protein n=1 Tax=Thalassospira xiamenensis TaxID=220697 RepID=A0A285TSN6_9PROT|nr:hypothetical protein [Thalassospira xiamenensis]SOC26573.1 hypothetical protein SAMN05428964_105138 [Thalassospira xiamenensis]